MICLDVFSPIIDAHVRIIKCFSCVRTHRGKHFHSNLRVRPGYILKDGAFSPPNICKTLPDTREHCTCSHHSACIRINLLVSSAQNRAPAPPLRHPYVCERFVSYTNYHLQFPSPPTPPPPHPLGQMCTRVCVCGCIFFCRRLLM